MHTTTFTEVDNNKVLWNAVLTENMSKTKIYMTHIISSNTRSTRSYVRLPIKIPWSYSMCNFRDTTLQWDYDSGRMQYICFNLRIILIEVLLFSPVIRMQWRTQDFSMGGLSYNFIFILSSPIISDVYLRYFKMFVISQLFW